MRTQIILREKFREVQQAKYVLNLRSEKVLAFNLISKSFRCKLTGNTGPRPMPDSVNIEELVTKGLRRINVLIEKPVDLKSSTDLEKRMEDINVSVTRLI